MQSPSRSGPFQHLIKLVFLTIVAKCVVIKVNLQHTICALKNPLEKHWNFLPPFGHISSVTFPSQYLSFNSETKFFGLAVSLAGSRLWTYASWPSKANAQKSPVSSSRALWLIIFNPASPRLDTSATGIFSMLVSLHSAIQSPHSPSIDIRLR